MNLAAIDLNLLVAFEALIETRNVTRAGQRVGLAQPSMSSALARLRALLDDELFVRTAQGMRPTPRALVLARPISEALEQIRRTLDPEPVFDPAAANRRFTLGVTDYGDLIVVPEVIRALRRVAPGVDLAVRPITRANDSLAQLERGEIDALIGGHLPDGRRTARQHLFDEHFVCIRDAGETLPLTAADYIDRPHALFSAMGGDGLPGAVDAVLSGLGFSRRIALTAPHVVAIPFAVAGTDMVATMSGRIARRLATTAAVEIVTLPFDLPAFAIDLVRAAPIPSAAVHWFIELVRTVCGTI